ncbi:tellurite resistance TerB family protein [Pseudoxanthobacter sp. M-2]|uniref:tellurite resistance TerB family protein n=1 Tax=Pseudoxanthobacter sp. M-2 TaxID=3078754 RepID=UPI0038FD0FA5
MIDTKKLLDQFLGAGAGGQGGGLGGGLGGALGGMLGGGRPGAQGGGQPGAGGGQAGGLGGLGDMLGGVLGGGKGGGGGLGGALGGGMGGLAGGALAGGLVSVLLGSKGARKLGGKALTYGGLAVVGALAYSAYRNWQAQQSGQPAPAPVQPGQPLALPPPETPFHPAHAPGGEGTLALTLLHAMIAAAKADGHVDADERARIVGRLDDIGLSAEDRDFLEAELAAPIDIDRLVREASTPAVAAEIYAASLLVITPDHPAEQAYLQLLAARLGLDPGLKIELEKAVAAATVG